MGDEAHIYVYEAGGASALGGVAYHVIQNTPNGELPLSALQRAVRYVALSSLDFAIFCCPSAFATPSPRSPLQEPAHAFTIYATKAHDVQVSLSK